jgi:hypothetical protein
MTAGYFPFGDGEPDDEDGYDEDGYDEDEEDTDDIEDEIARLLRPRWLHPDCPNVCTALELGTCCKYPDNPLVRVAVELADSVDRTRGRLGGGDCAGPAAELSRLFTYVPGLLAQVHAILPRLNGTAVAQLLCPVDRLASALDQACAHGCPWACHDPGVPGRRAEFEPLLPLLGDCSNAIRAALGWRHR